MLTSVNEVLRPLLLCFARWWLRIEHGVVKSSAQKQLDLDPQLLALLTCWMLQCVGKAFWQGQLSVIWKEFSVQWTIDACRLSAGWKTVLRIFRLKLLQWYLVAADSSPGAWREGSYFVGFLAVND